MQFSVDIDSTSAYLLTYLPTEYYNQTYSQDSRTPFSGKIGYESLDYNGSLDGINAKLGHCQSISITYCNYDSDSNIITITFPPSANNLSSLEIAALILHEGIHAELRRIYEGNNQVLEPLPQAQYDYLVSLWDYYKGILPANSVSNYASHTFMVYNHVEPLASAIRELDDNYYNLNHYMWYGWDGLSDIGKNTIPQLLTNAQEDNYQNLQQITINDQKKQSCDD